MAGVFEPPPFHPSRPGLVAPVALDPRGRAGPTPGQARGTGWRRSSRGFYVPSGVNDANPDQRILEASVVTPAGGAVTGWAALRWRGGTWFDGSWGGRSKLPVTIATAGRTVRRQQGIAICEEGLDPTERSVLDGLSVTSAVRSACFEMRYAPSDRLAVVALDMAAYSDLVSLAEMADYAGRHSGWTGIPRCRWALGHADENAWSPHEVLMRLGWELDAGRPRPLCNVPVFDRSGRLVGTPDLLDPEAGVLGEYDGALHLAGRQRAVDLRREAEFRGLGLETVVMVAADHQDMSSFLTRLDGAYRRARHEAESTRAWTISPPPWWTDTSTVAARRTLDADQQRRWLRHRRVG